MLLMCGPIKQNLWPANVQVDSWYWVKIGHLALKPAAALSGVTPKLSCGVQSCSGVLCIAYVFGGLTPSACCRSSSENGLCMARLFGTSLHGSCDAPSKVRKPKYRSGTCLSRKTVAFRDDIVEAPAELLGLALGVTPDRTTLAHGPTPMSSARITWNLLNLSRRLFALRVFSSA